MTPLAVIHALGTLAVIATAVAAWAFVLTYRRRNWRLWEEGRNAMHMTAGIAVICTYASVIGVATLCGVRFDPVPQALVRLAIFVWLAGVVAWRVRILRRSR